MDDDLFIIDLLDLEFGFSVWQVCAWVVRPARPTPPLLFIINNLERDKGLASWPDWCMGDF